MTLCACCIQKALNNSLQFKHDFNIKLAMLASLRETIGFDRTIGQSKMSKKIILEAIVRVPIFRLKRMFGIS